MEGVPPANFILRQLWSEQQWLFILISPVEQWALHEYYLCDEKATEESLVKYYQQIKSPQPSLPDRAGKNDKLLSVRSLVQPSVDVDAT